MFQKAITLLCETPGHCLTKGCSKDTERAGWVDGTSRTCSYDRSGADLTIQWLRAASRHSKVLNGRLPLFRCFAGLGQANDVRWTTFTRDVLWRLTITSVEERVCSGNSRRWRRFGVGHYRHERLNCLGGVCSGEFLYFGNHFGSSARVAALAFLKWLSNRHAVSSLL